MIAAAGRLDMAALGGALRAMAGNDNPAYDHELRSEGAAVRHDCGWGVAYRDGDTLVRIRSAESCLTDPEFDRLSGIETDLAILHARRNRDRSTIDIANSHPFVAGREGVRWAFCHNGEVRDLSRLDSDPSLATEGGTDSELLFHHVLLRIDPARPALSMARSLAAIDDFTCLNCFLASPDRIVAYARTPSDTERPLYYTLWRGGGDLSTLVSSEPVFGMSAEWSVVPAGEVLEVHV